MAIGINNVYNQVLAIANKEQRGYVTPQEFNLLARKAQNDIFESYIYNYKTALAMPSNQDKLADDLEILRDKIAPFRVIDSEVSASGALSGGEKIHWLENVYDAGSNRTIEISMPARSAFTDNTSSIKLRAIFGDDGSKGGIGEVDIEIRFNLTDGSTTSPEGTGLSRGDFWLHIPSTTTTNSQVAKLFKNRINDTSKYHSASIKEGTGNENIVVLTYNQRGISGSETISNITGGTISTVSSGTALMNINYEEVSHQDLIYMNGASKLKPSSSRPIYYRKNATNIVMSPVPSGPVSCNYIKKPTDPSWAYVVVKDKALYNSNSSVDFMLHASEESTLVNKIIELAGIVINKPDLSQAILQNEQIKEALKNK